MTNRLFTPSQYGPCDEVIAEYESALARIQQLEAHQKQLVGLVRAWLLSEPLGTHAEACETVLELVGESL